MENQEKGRLSDYRVRLEAINDTYPALGVCQFAERIGRGRTSDVYKLVRDEQKDKVIGAAKVPREGLGDNLSEAFRQEANVLRQLRERARMLGVRPEHFPEPIYFNPNQRDVKFGNFALLVLEYIDADKFERKAEHMRKQNVLDLEKVCLEAGLQYADVLRALHASNLTCADRKVGDIRSRADETLVVLDWNVVHEGPEGRIVDLNIFGKFWFQFLVGQEPHFKGKQGRKVALLDHEDYHAQWEGLSVGTQAILRKALHPIPKCRYPTAEELRGAIEQHLKRWQTADPDDLIRGSALESLPASEKLAVLDIVQRRKPELDQATEMEQFRREIRASQLERPRQLIKEGQYGDAIPLLEEAIAELAYCSAERYRATQLYLLAQAGSNGFLHEAEDRLASIAPNVTQENAVPAAQGTSSSGTTSRELALFDADLTVRGHLKNAEEYDAAAEYVEAADAYRKALDAWREQEWKLADHQEDFVLRASGGDYSQWDDLSVNLPDLYEGWKMLLRHVRTRHDPIVLLGASCERLLAGEEGAAKFACAKAQEWAAKEADSPVHKLVKAISGFQGTWKAGCDALRAAAEQPDENKIEQAYQKVREWRDSNERTIWRDALTNKHHRANGSLSNGLVRPLTERLLGNRDRTDQDERHKAVEQVLKFLSDMSFAGDKEKLLRVVYAGVENSARRGTIADLQAALALLDRTESNDFEWVCQSIQTLSDQQQQMCEVLAGWADEQGRKLELIVGTSKERAQRQAMLAQWLQGEDSSKRGSDDDRHTEG